MSLRDSRRPVEATGEVSAVTDVDLALRRMESRRVWGVRNRRLGWVILPLVVFATVVHFGPGQPVQGEFRYSLVLAMQFVYAPMAAVHAYLSFYVFGWVRPSRTLRVFHIWFGYAYAVLILASQTSWAFPTAHGILTMLMFGALTAHVAIGVHYARRRRSSGVTACAGTPKR